MAAIDNLTPAVDRMKQVKVYPLEGEADAMEFFEVSDVPAFALWHNDHRFFEQLDRAVQAMELATFDPYMNGVMASLGIQKGITFAPTSEQKVMLDRAAQTAWKISKETALNFNEKSSATGDTWFWKEGGSWVAHALTNAGDQNYSMLDAYWRSKETGYTQVDAAMHMWTNHYSISNAMINAKVNAGAKYAGAYKDSDLNPLVGTCNYSLNVPANAPAGLFWSVTIYDAATASGAKVKNHDYPSLGDRDEPVENADGSVTLYFGPTAPDDSELADNNWLQFSEPGWFSLIRFYGPQAPLFDGTWIPGEFEKINCVE